jgi:outer membrane protein OmpA-like peptidoglycan-associated protein
MRRYLLIGFLCALAGYTAAQSPEDLKKADNDFNLGKYEQALDIYLKAYQQNPKDPAINYKIGVCYFRSRDAKTQQKATPFLEFAAANPNEQVPYRVYHYLGRMYHLNYQFDKALAQLDKFKGYVNDKDRLWGENQRAIEMCQNGKVILKDTLDLFVQNIGKPINTELTEYGSVISADEQLMAYTTARKDPQTGEIIEQIYLSKKKDYVWTTPEIIDFKTNKNVGSVGMSPDGQQILIYIGGVNNTGSIYSSRVSGSQWSEPKKLGNEINSDFMETTASISPDGNVMYFASNRPGGYGGRDLYKVERLPNGSWGKPSNLGPEVNTPYDEDAPFIHPDKKTLYFSSTGHNSIGGSDIFKASFENGKWTKPKNMGFPINSTYNDSYFVLSADGKKGYFSSDRLGGYGMQDIYFLGIPEEEGVIALTLVKGKILAGTPPKPIPTRIRVVDKETNEFLKYIYDPNPKTGDYLMIFPPGKNYDMIIEAEGYLPYLVNINIPNQTYFYEMYQEIILQKKIVNNQEVGQEISVTNAFFDVRKEVSDDPVAFSEKKLDLYDLMDDIIASEDSTALNYLLELMYDDEPVDLKEVVSPQESVQVTFFYNAPDGKLKPLEVAGQTILALDKVETDKNRKKEEEDYSINQGPILKNKTYTAFFESNQFELNSRALEELVRFADFVKANKEVGIQILGYASSEGDADANFVLSESRAKAAYEFFLELGIDKKRLIWKGFGSNKSSDPEAARRKMRRADIKIVDLKNLKKFDK